MEFLHIEVNQSEPAVAVIKLQRQQAMNALNNEIVSELKVAVGQLEINPDVRSVVIVGEEKFFIAGADIKEMINANVTDAIKISQEMKALHDLVIHSEKPYIAAIQGVCLGGGLELALACDIRVADDTAKFGLPEINLGIIPGGGGIQRLTQLTGVSYASELMMTGEMIDADEALQWKIINSISDDVVTKAMSIGRSISLKSHFAITALKKLINKRHLNQSQTQLEEEIYEFALLFNQSDAFEGMSAFIEKRKPVFQKEE